MLFCIMGRSTLCTVSDLGNDCWMTLLLRRTMKPSERVTRFLYKLAKFVTVKYRAPWWLFTSLFYQEQHKNLKKNLQHVQQAINYHAITIPTPYKPHVYGLAVWVPVLALLLLATGAALLGTTPAPTLVFARCTVVLLLFVTVFWLFPHFPVNVSIILRPKVRIVPPVAEFLRVLLLFLLAVFAGVLTGVVLITWALGGVMPLELLGEVGEKPPSLNSQLGFCWFAKDFWYASRLP